MRLEGVHHVTAITADAPRNVDFYAGVLGLRLVKKTVNQDDPTVYHLFYADEKGSPGSRHHLLRVPGARAGPGRRRHGAPRRLAGRPTRTALDFWASGCGDGSASSARRAALRRPRRARARARRRDASEDAADRGPPRDPGRARAARLRRRARVRARPGRERRVPGALGFERRGAGRRAASSAAAPTPTTGAGSAGCPAPAPCTTSPGARRRRSTRRGGSA